MGIEHQMLPELVQMRNLHQGHLDTLLADFPLKSVEVDATYQDYTNNLAEHLACRQEQLRLQGERESSEKKVEQGESQKTAACSPVLMQVDEFSCQKSDEESDDEYLESIVKLAASANK